MNFVFTFYSSMNPEKVSHVIASQKYSLFKSFVTIYTSILFKSLGSVIFSPSLKEINYFIQQGCVKLITIGGKDLYC